MIHVSSVSKTFRVHKKAAGFVGSFKSLFKREWLDKHALQNVSIDIGQGEIVGLVGANGAGKTTLVKILAGIIHPTSGEAKVLNHIPFERDIEFRRQISLIMGQKAQLWWDLPAEDCFLLLKEIYQIPTPDYKRNLDYLVEALGVKDQLNIQIRRLSLGERMKMELIAALLHQPRVVFLDEPTIGLDLTAQMAIRKFISDYRKQNKPAMILTSHYMEDIEKLCKRIAIIKEGQIVYDGDLSKVIDKYATQKVLSVAIDIDAQAMPSESELAVTHVQGVVIEGNVAKLRVDRKNTTAVANTILQKFKIKDLSIVEEDIGNIIEALIRKDKK